MQDEHAFIWKAMLDTIETDLTGRRVLDAGCNRGGFLRLLVDAEGVDEGYGYDRPREPSQTPDASRPTDHSPSRSPTRCRTDGATSALRSVTRSFTCWRVSLPTRLLSLAP